MRYERHVFVCTHRRSDGHPRGCCGSKGADALRAALKRQVVEHGLKGRIRINRAGCLDQCEYGANLVVYPEGVWYAGVREEDTREIFERHLVGGEVVERLRLAPELVNEPHHPGPPEAISNESDNPEPDTAND